MFWELLLLASLYASSAIKGLLMQIIAKCPKCGSPWLLEGGAADHRIRCRKCGKLFKVPRMDDIPKATKVIRQAKGPIYVDESGKTYG
jgi:uncharacterized protein (DUF983 family)